MERSGMGRRRKTMMQHVRLIEKFEEHCRERGRGHWHGSVAKLFEYIEVRAEEPQTRSWFGRFRCALAYVEAAGEVPVLERYRTAPPSRAQS